MSRIKAILGLVAVAACWGMTFPVVKGAVAHVSPAAFVAGRFALASVMLLPVLRGRVSVSRHTLWAGAGLGLLNGAVYLLLTASLEYISAARCAFLVGTNVALVPFLSHAAGLSRVRRMDLVSAALCLAGLYCLTGADLRGISLGDGLMLGCEVFFAISLVLMTWAVRHGASAHQLTFYQVVFTVPLPLLLAILGEPVGGLDHPEALWALGFCALVATPVPLLLQARCLAQVSAPTAALILALEPVFAAAFASAVYGEPITRNMVEGASFMFLAAVLPELRGLWDRWRPAYGNGVLQRK